MTGWLPHFDELLGRPGQWRNWGRTASARPLYVSRPGSVENVIATIERAAERGQTVKAVGSGHSFSAIAAPRDVELTPEHQSGLESVDVSAKRVTLRGGTRLADVPALLAPYGLAMRNLGDVDRQTIAGAISTGTHGTGHRFGGLATQVVSATLVSGRGEVITVEADDPRLSAVALGLGALGVLLEVTVQCVDAFVIESKTQREPLGAVTDTFAERSSGADHFEFFWFAGTDAALTKTGIRHPADHKREPRGAVRGFVEDQVIGNGALLGISEVGRFAPALTPPLVGLVTSLAGGGTVIDDSASVFVSDRRVRFRETEWALPIENTMAAFEELRAETARRDWNLTFPVEVRVAAQDDLMLSTASGRESGYIAAHRYHRDPPSDYFAEVERIMLAHEGRPHWGKMHTRERDFFQTSYPRFDEFLAVRDELDPDRIFANDYLDSVLGD